MRKEYKYVPENSFYLFYLFAVAEIYVILMIIAFFKAQSLSVMNAPLYLVMLYGLLALIWVEYKTIKSVLIVDDDGITRKGARNARINWSDVSRIKYKKGFKIFVYAKIILYSHSGEKIRVSSSRLNYNEMRKIIYRKVKSKSPQAKIDKSFKALMEKIIESSAKRQN